MTLNFKAYNFNTKQSEGNTLIFDIVRKKYVRLTPEEWVRQNVIQFLIHEVRVPKGLIAVEKSLIFNGLNKRFDLCVADSSGKMKLLVECKAPSVQLTQQTLMQAAVYQKILEVNYLFISNGMQHLFFQFDDLSKPPSQLPHLPLFEDWI